MQFYAKICFRRRTKFFKFAFGDNYVRTHGDTLRATELPAVWITRTCQPTQMNVYYAIISARQAGIRFINLGGMIG